MKATNKIAFGGLGVFLLMQLIRIDYTHPPVDSKKEFVQLYSPTDSIQKMIQNSCYDCHSNESKYPWYAQIAPISWMVGHHIKEGREKLNFSEFGNYNALQKEHVLAEAVETIQKGEMPMGSYVLMHQAANLNASQKNQLVAYFSQIRSQVLNEAANQSSLESSLKKETTESDTLISPTHTIKN